MGGEGGGEGATQRQERERQAMRTALSQRGLVPADRCWEAREQFNAYFL